MKAYTIDIAEYKIMFQARGHGFELKPSSSQRSFISSSPGYDIAINVTRGRVIIPPGAEAVFKSPYVEEINGVPVKKSDNFWTVYKHGDYILVYSTMPLSDTIGEAMIIIRPGEKSWDIILNTDDEVINPIGYPLDGLLLYYITALNGDIFIHASGVECDKLGLLFTGQSGRGKTTIARLFDEAGAAVIHDDRLIIRKIDGQYMMYNTPVYEMERSNYCRLTKIYTLDHGLENRLTALGSVESLTSVMKNCIQHHWNSDLIGKLTTALKDMTDEVDVSALEFIPDKSVVDFIRNDSC